ncbi:MAG: alpha-glucosidase [Clostridia bacterium]|nr:alpha-glucosidase [Clostridia bacterium]
MISDKYKHFLEWIIYQIYPRSFYDTNGDGVGDLNGITQKIEHLKELGVNAVWLSPCYKSPNVDNGYDVSDYRDIMDEFGTLEDWKNMRNALHDRGIKLIMDFVPNHTSNQHEWFIKSKKKIPPYTDYYYWADEPLNDWQACFGGSAWEYSEERGQYYLHSYAVEQPDLNFDNPNVREEMKSIIDFWIDLGVDGFRIDVIDQISKDFDGNKNRFGPHLHEYIRELFGREKTKNIFTVGECWATDIDEVIRHCAENRNELSCLFQFDHIEHGKTDRFTPAPFTLKAIAADISKWQTLTVQNGLLYTLFMDNHDQPRFLSRFGNDKDLRYESATMFAGMFYLGRGIPFIYQGQEFGMTNSRHEEYSHFRDVENKHFYHSQSGKLQKSDVLDRLNFGSRDNARRPVAWNCEKYGGFSSVEPWIPTYSRYQEINLEKDKNSEKSIFEFYKKLLAFRKNSPMILYGAYKEITGENNDCYIYEREYQGEKIIVVCNFEKENQISCPYTQGELLLTNYNRANNLNGNYAPYELAVFKI